MNVRHVRLRRGVRSRRLRLRLRRYAGTGDRDRRMDHNPYAVALAASAPVILTALLFYFGWARTKLEAAELGYDVTMYEMTIQDFLLKSVPALFIPLLLLPLSGLGAVLMHRRVVRQILGAPHRRRLQNRLAAALVYSWIGWAVVGIVLTILDVGAAVPLCLTAALACALYGNRLRARSTRSVAVRALLSVMLGLSLIWDVERMAGWFGTATARDIVANPSELATVTVFSAEDLLITAPGVRVTKVGDSESAYTHRYDGLVLLHRAGDRLVLIPPVWDPHRSQVIVLKETDSVRFEFSRTRR